MDIGRTVNFPLISNGYTLASTPNRLGWLLPSDPGEPVRRLWEQFNEQGYLWLKGLLDRSDVLDFRRRYFSAFARTGLLAPGSDPLDAIYSFGEVDFQAVRQIQIEAVRWAAYES